ncbi:alpha/beta fold hydrolase [Zooshikella harenae]|uniref:Dienelactone hydrolase family protein n=1 Tax=Zooshikella harenae TaxID=2827238 RepID=A0ABS5Z747_9GAMM|nr:alpha/beta fold hydrolase [Zooshikella harenae]MBU2709825.1 dienelactone hydrolase family protein [Zooshikella harenae]
MFSELPLCWTYTHQENAPCFVFAHGAGAPMDSPFMSYFTEAIAGLGVNVMRFEFPYMDQRRHSGKKRPPDRQPKLIACWEYMVQQLQTQQKVIIGGKSMGGRMATLLAASQTLPANVQGIVCLGYPFYAAGKRDKPRIEHLQTLKLPTCIVQGTRDSLGNKHYVQDYSLSAAIQIHWLAEAGHDLVPSKRSGFLKEEHWLQAAKWVAHFCHEI